MQRDDFISLNDFCGSAEHSPSGEWTIAHGILLDSSDTEDKNFRVLRYDHVVAQGKLAQRIDRGSIANSGHFALSFFSDDADGGTPIWFFEPDGKQYTSIHAPRFVTFFTIHDGGKQVLFSYDEKLFLLDLSPVWQKITFDLPPRFYPESGFLSEGYVYLSDRTGGPYRFSDSGQFLDNSQWLERFAAQADGETLFLTFRQMTSNTEGWSSADYRNAAGWIEEAIRRGIRNSFHVKVADAYSTLAWLKDKGGDTEGADQARSLQEENEDGFRVVDSIGHQMKELCSTDDKVRVNNAIERLTRAVSYEHFSDYPNYYGRLFRFMGELYYYIDDLKNAEQAFIQALQINPKVGCKKLLEKIQKEEIC